MNNTDVLHFRAINVIRLRLQSGRLFAALVGLLWSNIMATGADTHYVSLAGENVAPYTNGWASAATQIQWAVNQAVVGDTVLVSNGTYTLTNQINILTNLTVKSLNGANVTFINGNYPDYTNRCVYMKAGVLDGFTISNGYDAGTTANSGGGGVYLYEGSATGPAVYNCYIYRNYCYNTNTYSGGGGIYIKGNTTTYIGGTISNCSIVGNTVYTNSLTGGGGIYTYYGGWIINCYISGNSAYSGGGMRAYRGTVITNSTVANNCATTAGGISIEDTVLTRGVANCVISNNVAYPLNGGGIVSTYITVKDSIIIGNVGRDGGGGVMFNGSVWSNCQVVANTASNWPGGGMGGGGIYVSGANNASVIANCFIISNASKSTGGGLSVNAWGGVHEYVRNCLIYGNTNSAGTGGGVFTYNSGAKTNSFINCTIVANDSRGVYVPNNQANARFENCIVYSNKLSDLYPSTGTIITSCWYTCHSTALADGQGNITNNPMLADWLSHNYYLSDNSPCINAGTNQAWMDTAVDLDGKPRILPAGGIVDIGAYETPAQSSDTVIWLF